MSELLDSVLNEKGANHEEDAFPISILSANTAVPHIWMSNRFGQRGGGDNYISQSCKNNKLIDHYQGHKNSNNLIYDAELNCKAGREARKRREVGCRGTLHEAIYERCGDTASFRYAAVCRAGEI